MSQPIELVDFHVDKDVACEQISPAVGMVRTEIAFSSKLKSEVKKHFKYGLLCLRAWCNASIMFDKESRRGLWSKKRLMEAPWTVRLCSHYGCGQVSMVWTHLGVSASWTNFYLITFCLDAEQLVEAVRLMIAIIPESSLSSSFDATSTACLANQFAKK